MGVTTLYVVLVAVAAMAMAAGLILPAGVAAAGAAWLVVRKDVRRSFTK